jgi:hypothetical protein
MRATASIGVLSEDADGKFHKRRFPRYCAAM